MDSSGTDITIIVLFLTLSALFYYFSFRLIKNKKALDNLLGNESKEAFIKKLNDDLSITSNKITNISAKLEPLERKADLLYREGLLASQGLVAPIFTNEHDEKFRAEILEFRRQQKQGVGGLSITVNGSSRQSGLPFDIMVYENSIKIIMRNFNEEFDVIVRGLNARNAQSRLEKLDRMAGKVRKWSSDIGMTWPENFSDYKREELKVWITHAKDLEVEKNKRKIEKETLRAQAKIAKDVDTDELESDMQDSQRELEWAKQRAQEVYGDVTLSSIKEIKQLEAKLDKMRANIERVKSQAELTKAGYVYCISNVGAMGKGVVKIGMTRRLEPLDRVKELGDASVPFPFDVHALIFDSDAPALETKLHNIFDSRRVNVENNRKEFFKVNPREVAEACEKLSLSAKWRFDSDAVQFYESELQRKARSASRRNVSSLGADKSSSMAEVNT